MLGACTFIETYFGSAMNSVGSRPVFIYLVFNKMKWPFSPKSMEMNNAIAGQNLRSSFVVSWASSSDHQHEQQVWIYKYIGSLFDLINFSVVCLQQQELRPLSCD